MLAHHPSLSTPYLEPHWAVSVTSTNTWNTPANKGRTTTIFFEMLDNYICELFPVFVKQQKGKWSSVSTNGYPVKSLESFWLDPQKTLARFFGSCARRAASFSQRPPPWRPHLHTTVAAVARGRPAPLAALWRPGDKKSGLTFPLIYARLRSERGAF